MSQLSITIDLDDDGTAGLSAHFVSQRFSGFGEGWFNLSDITEFCRSFEKLANSVEGETELVAGQSKVDGSGYLEYLGLRCYVVSESGILGVHVTLSEYPYTDCRPQEISRVSGELKVEIQSALSFIQGLRSLCSGGVTEAVLVGRR